MTKNYTMNTGIVAVLLPLTILFPFNGLAQSKNALVGTWKLLSATETTKTGEVRDVSGWKNPTGLLTYTADGRVMVIMTSGGRKPLSVGATAEEKAELFTDGKVEIIVTSQKPELSGVTFTEQSCAVAKSLLHKVVTKPR